MASTDPSGSEPSGSGEAALADSKQAVQDFWDEASCGEEALLDGLTREDYLEAAARRYDLEPYIREFAEFETGAGKRVLEIGVGLGADHQLWAQSGAQLFGIDLTPRAIEHTQRRFDWLGLSSTLQCGDAEQLDFDDGSFEIVYSWGVLHHSPDTPQAIKEVHRVLAPGGVAKIMIYHKYSVIGLMLWLRYGLLRGRPFRKLADLYAQYLESPGTKAYTVAEARELFADFRQVEIETVLTHGDLLTSQAGQRHTGPLLDLARKIWPRWLIRRLAPGAGLFMLITAHK
ncbi:MAG: class I SAM-dependent methyltransferase [Deltaproteobacteria bacterium]|nr:class I SAM-dependent methyltransferase [Deltaproteobacteria bacterium]MBW2724498.1 class I SAM-dependent methyltransferase [Deltaproteobacteria bacterium]